MPRSKEIPEDLRKQVVEAHQSGKGYNHIAKALGLQKTTIRSIVHKWRRFGTVVTLPRSGRPPKISPSARREIIQEVMKNPCTTPKDLQATLASANIHVHDSTIRKFLDIHSRPSLSCFDDGMGLQMCSREEETSIEASGGPSQEIKLEEDHQVLDIVDTEPARSGKNKSKRYTGGGENEKCNNDGENVSTDISEHGVDTCEVGNPSRCGDDSDNDRDF